jgi:UDP-N-acetylmuramoyl-tripeptide--D-alanyl-D-alanine ligase
MLKRFFVDQILPRYFAVWARLVLWVQKPLIIGVTGSVGKTTTTDMIATILMSPGGERMVGRVHKTSENMNDDLGLPLTILRYGRISAAEKLLALCLAPYRALRFALSSRYPRILVLEYGTHWKGHLHALARLAPPRIAVVTVVGPAHLQRLKTVEGVAREKVALVRAVPPSGLVILGVDHAYVSFLEQASRAPVLKVSGRGVDLSRNIALAVGRHLGVPEELMMSALSDFKLPYGRLTLLDLAAFTIIDGTFNANPLSMKLGLDVLAESARPGQRRVAILGAMVGVGNEYHAEIAAYARSRADLLIGVGDLAKHYAPDRWFESSEACAAQVEGLVRVGDRLLVKGSGPVHLEHVVRRLRQIGLCPPPQVRDSSIERDLVRGADFHERRQTV